MRNRRMILPFILLSAWVSAAAAAGPSFVVERRVNVGSERFREFRWAPTGGRLAALTFRQLMIVDAATGDVDTIGPVGVQQMVWSPQARWIGARTTPAFRAGGRERRSVMVVIAAQPGGEGPRVRAVTDTVTIASELRRTLGWAGPDLMAVCQDSVWTTIAVVPGAEATPGARVLRMGTPVYPGTGDRIFLAEVNPEGRIEERELPAPPSILSDFGGRPGKPLPLWWLPTRMTPDGAHMLFSAREPVAGDVNLILAPDGRVEHRFEDGLVATDLSADAKWILSQAETMGTQVLDSSELFLVRVADGRAFPLTGTLGVVETDAAFEPGTMRVACLDQKDGSILIGRIEGLPTP